MTNLLAGFSDGLHDRSVCLFDGAEPICAIEEERITRVKHGLDLRGERRDDPAAFAHLNLEADEPRVTRPGLDAMLAYCLETAGVTGEDVVLCGSSLHDARPWNERAIFVNHHLAHAASAFYSSGFEDAAVIVADGYGDRSGAASYETVMIAHGHGHALEPVLTVSGKTSSYFDMQHSLGVFYRLGTLLSGFALLEEGKAMGLAAYGEAALRDRIAPYVDRHSAGVRIDNRAIWRSFADLRATELGFAERADIAATFQSVLEDCMLHYAGLASDLVPSTNLCLAGGVALNCVANGKVAVSGPFDDVFVPPAPADNGIAFGAGALLAHAVQRLPRTPQMRRKSWGRTYPDIAPADHAPTGWTVVLAGDGGQLAEAVADVLADGEIVAAVRGGSEFGPRALGHRSFLANPATTEMRDFINAKVKFRELFRPLAPMVPEEDVNDWFDWTAPSPFMLFTVPARPELAEAAPGIVHHDGTARLQTVERDTDPFLHMVLRAFGERTGCPVLLNTSLNGRGEPIVETPEQALVLLESAPVSYLLLDDRLLRKVVSGDEESRDA